VRPSAAGAGGNPLYGHVAVVGTPQRNFRALGLVSWSMRSRSDHALVRATARGDEAAFAALVARHRPSLVRYATSRCGRDGALAEDAVQDALVRAHRAIVGGKLPVDVEAWLYAIVRNRCHDYFRAARPTAPLPPELPGGAPSAFEVVERAERLAGALDAVEALPSAQRAALVGRELEGRSYEEIAVRQETSVSAVKSLLHRARVTLAHGASLPAFAVPLLARLPRLRAGQVLGGLIAEQTSGAAAIATIAIAGTSALGALHAPDPPAGPTAAQSRSALVTAERGPHATAPMPKARRKDPLDAEYGPAALGSFEYGP
jgi:RNA polymerase sigma factor (sigma-70 family)